MLLLLVYEIGHNKFTSVKQYTGTGYNIEIAKHFSVFIVLMCNSCLSKYITNVCMQGDYDVKTVYMYILNVW